LFRDWGLEVSDSYSPRTVFYGRRGSGSGCGDDDDDDDDGDEVKVKVHLYCFAVIVHVWHVAVQTMVYGRSRNRLFPERAVKIKIQRDFDDPRLWSVVNLSCRVT
jgi:hypothetical protein